MADFNDHSYEEKLIKEIGDKKGEYNHSGEEELIKEIKNEINKDDITPEKTRRLLKILEKHSQTKTNNLTNECYLSSRKLIQNIRAIHGNENLRNVLPMHIIFTKMNILGNYLKIDTTDYQLHKIHKNDKKVLMTKVIEKIENIDVNKDFDGTTHLLFLYLSLFEINIFMPTFVADDHYTEFKKIKILTNDVDVERKIIELSSKNNRFKEREIKEFLESYCKIEKDYWHESIEKFLTISPKRFFLSLKILHEVNKDLFLDIISHLYSPEVLGCLYCIRQDNKKINNMEQRISENKSIFIKDLENYIQENDCDEDNSQIMFFIIHMFDKINNPEDIF